MAQPPFQVDAIQIEPGSGSVLTISKDTTTDSLRFVDDSVPSGINLVDLASLRAINDLYLVGKQGTGAAYNTIAEALAAVSASSSPSSPSVILVTTGTYQENITINKDGIALIAMGRVVLEAAAATPTVTITSAVTTHPTYCLLRGFRIENAHDGQSCVSVIGGSGSTVGSVGVIVDECDLYASGVGTRQVVGDTVNHITVLGGTWTGSSTSLSLLQQCASLDLSGLRGGNALQIDYNNALPVPSVAGSANAITNSRLGDVQATLQGVGSLLFSGCPELGDVTLSGDRPVDILGCKVGNMVVNAGVDVEMQASSRGAASGAGTLTEPIINGVELFAAEALRTVSFDIPQKDASYAVSLDHGINARVLVTNKVAGGFDIEFPSGVQTGDVYYAVIRRL